jgi:thimet oligopeptidase
MLASRILYFSILAGLGLGFTANAKTVADFADAATEHKVTLTIPEFPTTPDAIKKSIDGVIARYTEVGDQVAQQDPSQVTFQSTMGVFDDLDSWAESQLNPIGIVENTSTDAELRKVATDEFLRFQDFAVGFSYREDVYAAVKAYADTKPALDGEEARLFNDTMASYKRRGFELSKEARTDVEAMQKEVSKLSTEFEQNIRETDTIEKFTKAELDGLPDDFLESVKTGDDEYSFSGKIAAHFSKVLTLAKNEETRKRMLSARSRHAMAVNLPVLQKVVKLRSEIANRLGYATWADYKTEDRMAKNEKTVRLFLEELSRGLQPKFEAELAALRAIKVKETGKTDAEIQSWDTFYYEDKLLQQDYAIDNEALRVYFPYSQCLAGLFEVYETIFGLKIEEIENPKPWAEGVTLHAVSDASTGKPMGLFYLDMFPREGKYNHFAQFGIILGKERADKSYQRPTVALICNFPKPEGDKPSLLSFDEVETLFHEFGHCMHSILTEAKLASHSCTSVPRDFVEAPSQVLEYWLRDKQVLDLFAADYRDPSKKIPAEVLKNLDAADLAQAAMHYRGQIGYAMTDLLMHNFAHPIQVQDVGKIGNDVLATYFLARPDDSAFVAGFGHLMGYDAGYYGYAWSDVIAADIASIFEKAPGRFLNKELGMKLRTEIFSRGDSRDVSESVEAFLGRPRTMDAFLIKLGIQ